MSAITYASYRVKRNGGKIRNKLEQMLLEGLESGDPIPVTPEFWEKIRNELMERHQTRTDAQ